MVAITQHSKIESVWGWGREDNVRSVMIAFDKVTLDFKNIKKIILNIENDLI